jgi:large subunit ribosomal protein L1
MKKEDILKAIKQLKENSEKRNFKQTIDLIITLKDLNLKKPEEQVDFFQNLHFPYGKKIKICALVGPELLSQAEENCDIAVSIDDFDKYVKDKKAIKKLAKEYDYFIAQANIMPKIAGVFGKVLGPRGKMPNPKSGCIVPPNANLKVLSERLKRLVRVSAKTMPMAQCTVGKEDSKEEEIADNVLTIYDALIHHLPKGKNNVKNILLKLTMSRPVKLM